ncbi:MAG: PHP domain-containing protein [Bacillota bacterium]
MKVYYDLHIHSSLSPCAADEMTPLNIVAMASVKGLQVIAVSDHNSIKNVEAAMECAKDFEIIVIPSMEVQTSEDIHVLTLFEDFESLKTFNDALTKRQIENKEHIFGRQLIIDADNNIVGKEKSFLMAGVEESIYTVVNKTNQLGGVAIPAHIDRTQNGIIAILADIPKDLDITAVELSKYAPDYIKDKYIRYNYIYNSDAHRLEDISEQVNYIEIGQLNAKSFLLAIKGG